MRLSAIIPVKSFSNAKTRLELPFEQKESLCKLMLEEVIETIRNCNLIEQIIVVSREEFALKLCKKFHGVEILDEHEISVNHAVSLADEYMKKNNFEASVVFPQDIPFMTTNDIGYLLSFINHPKFVLIVPSNHFDGTNALVRMPYDIIDLYYDNNSFVNHLKSAKSVFRNPSVVYARRIMFDIDTISDLRFAIHQNEKIDFIKKIEKLLDKNFL